MIERYEALPAEVRALYPWTGSPFVPSCGHAMHVLDEGPRHGEPVLMVHGNPTWSFYWRALVHGLSGTYRCVVPDHVGSGLSDKPRGWSYHLQDHVDNLVELIDHLELDRITLVVHDWGGPIGLGAGVARRDRVSRLVILNTSVFMEHVPLSIRICRTPIVGDLVVRGLNAAVRGAVLRSVVRRDALRGAAARGYAAPYRTWRSRVGHVGFFRDIPLEADHPTRSTIAQLTSSVPQVFASTPALFLWGDQDFVFTPRFLERWKELLPYAAVRRFADAGHWVMEDVPEQIVAEVRQFVAGAAS